VRVTSSSLEPRVMRFCKLLFPRAMADVVLETLGLVCDSSGRPKEKVQKLNQTCASRFGIVPVSNYFRTRSSKGQQS
jgi:hypothetical protein